MMGDSTIEKCVAMVLVAALAAVGPKFGMTEAMFTAATTGIFALAGTGSVTGFLRKQPTRKGGGNP